MKVTRPNSLLLAASACLCLVPLLARPGQAQMERHIVIRVGRHWEAKILKQIVDVRIESSDEKIATARYSDGYPLTIDGHSPGRAVITFQGEVVRYEAAAKTTPIQVNRPFSYTLFVEVIPDDPKPAAFESSITVEVGKSSSSQLFFNTSGFRLANSDESIASADLRGAVLEFKGLKPGKTKVTLSGKEVPSDGGPARPLKITYQVKVVPSPDVDDKKDGSMPSQSTKTLTLSYAEGDQGNDKGGGQETPPSPNPGGSGLVGNVNNVTQGMQGSGSGSKSTGDSSSTDKGTGKARLQISITPHVGPMVDGSLRVTLDAKEVAWARGDGLSDEAKKQCEAERSKVLDNLRAWSKSVSAGDKKSAAANKGMVTYAVSEPFQGLGKLKLSQPKEVKVEVNLPAMPSGPPPDKPEIVIQFDDEEGLPPLKIEKPKPEKPNDDGLPPPKPNKPPDQL